MSLTKLTPTLVFCAAWLFCQSSVFARDYYVSPSGSDTNVGSIDQPFLKIQKAATIMQPGDTCYIRAGTYREWVRPARGGTSETQRIVYKAYPGETPVIKGSECITNWVRERGNVWRADVSDNRIGPFNPYFFHVIGAYLDSGLENHLGDVYLNGKVLDEKYSRTSIDESKFTWFSEHHHDITTIWANFGDADPNAELAEILVRESVFAPVIPGLGYITLDGLTLQHGAANWAANTRDQKALVNVTAGHHWIIQDCHIADAKCAGICCGFTDTTDLQDLNSYGNNIVRNNLIERCGQAGIVGQHGWSKGLIEGNLIQDIDYRQRLVGDEMAAIKFHMAMDVTIRNNIIRRVHKGHGIWADWGNSGIRITGNVIYDIYDLNTVFFEMDHGPFIVDNNILIGRPLLTTSERMTYVHNLSVQSGTTSFQENFERGGSPIWQPHSKIPVASRVMPIATSGDRYFNNIFIGQSRIGTVGTNYEAGCNVYWQDATKNPLETNSIVNSEFDTDFTHVDLTNGVSLSFNADTSPAIVNCQLITHDFIGVDSVVKQGLEDQDGNPIAIDKDIYGIVRDNKNLTAGPFAKLKDGANSFVITAGPVAETR